MNLSVISQVKKGVVEYKKTFTRKVFSENDKKRSNRKFSKFEDYIIKAQDKLVFKLSFSNRESQFKVESQIHIEDNNFFEMAVGPDGEGFFYNSMSDRTRKLSAFGELFLISKQKYDWSVTNEVKMIGKYKCYKALLIEKYKTRRGLKDVLITAWFAPEINVPFGPIGYSGLPGLILELHKHRLKYYATKINLKPKKKIVIEKPIEGKKITNEGFNEFFSQSIKKYKRK